ncbi:MAG: tRNA (adenine(22)-N(1))-methyltransferase TrmK [Myxococcota bacterium]
MAPFDGVPPRLQALLSMVPPSAALADIGCDHGLLPIAAVLEGRVQYAVGIDRTDAILAPARRRSQDLGLQGRAVFRRGWGLRPLEEAEVQCIVLAGMGARTMVQCFQASSERLRSIDTVVVQPNRDVAEVRRWFYAHGYHIDCETLPVVGRRAFPSIRARIGAAPMPSDLALQLGPRLMEETALRSRLLDWARGLREHLLRLARQPGFRGSEARKLAESILTWERTNEAHGVSRTSDGHE